MKKMMFLWMKMYKTTLWYLKIEHVKRRHIAVGFPSLLPLATSITSMYLASCQIFRNSKSLSRRQRSVVGQNNEHSDLPSPAGIRVVRHQPLCGYLWSRGPTSAFPNRLCALQQSAVRLRYIANPTRKTFWWL